jgi:hypothetical protein
VPAVACACRLLLACLLLLRPVAKGVTAVSGLSAPCSYPAPASVLATFIASLRAKTNVLLKLSPLLLSLLFLEILLLAFADADTIHPVFYKWQGS